MDCKGDWKLTKIADCRHYDNQQHDVQLEARQECFILGISSRANTVCHPNYVHDGTEHIHNKSANDTKVGVGTDTPDGFAATQWAVKRLDKCSDRDLKLSKGKCQALLGEEETPGIHLY